MMEQVMGKMPERFARSGARAKPEYFKEGSKLDWPKPKASRQSKKDVRSCRSLQVRLFIRVFHGQRNNASSVGNHPSYGSRQSTVPRPREAVAHFRSRTTDNGQGRPQPLILLATNS